MPVPAFGFSVGDFVAITSVLWKIVRALNEANSDTQVFYDAQTVLLTFGGIITRLQNYSEQQRSSEPSQWAVIATLLQHSKDKLDRFEQYVRKFQTRTKIRTSVASLGSWRDRIGWSLSGVQKVQEFKSSIEGYSSLLSLALQALNKSALSNYPKIMSMTEVCDSETLVRTDQQAVLRSNELSVQMQRHADELRVQITAAISEPWDQRPVRFQDATGRRYPIPLEVCRTLEGLLNFLNHSFRNTPLTDMVSQRSIWLFTPVANQSKQWNLITASDWETTATPGMQLGMSVAENMLETDAGVKGVFDVKIRATISFAKPLPVWSTYPEDAEFQYIS